MFKLQEKLLIAKTLKNIGQENCYPETVFKNGYKWLQRCRMYYFAFMYQLSCFKETSSQKINKTNSH